MSMQGLQFFPSNHLFHCVSTDKPARLIIRLLFGINSQSVQFCPILSNFVQFCPILSNSVQCCLFNNTMTSATFECTQGAELFLQQHDWTSKLIDLFTILPTSNFLKYLCFMIEVFGVRLNLKQIMNLTQSC